MIWGTRMDDVGDRAELGIGNLNIECTTDETVNLLAAIKL
jgi:hypothetical protein